MPNRLARETSPYLLQHADNPVDWYAWGAEALEKAKREDKPILLSIGYSACHWCHVMEHECFEDAAIAARMNERFVCVKVDREERPDLDQVYQLVVQLMGRTGGWPLTVFLTPDQRPYFGGTYFPPEERHGLPAFPRVLDAMSDAYTGKRGDVEEQAQEMAHAIARAAAADRPAGDVGPGLLRVASAGLLSRFDHVNGGFGARPKFPNTMALSILLRRGVLEADADARSAVELALDKMRAGGIWDHLGGGFHRYSTDARWVVPHFEKMLYDNALLLGLYADGFRALGHERHRTTARELVRYLLAEMQDASGAFYAAQDADSEGHEGTFFVWTRAQIDAALDGDATGSEVLRMHLGVTEAGNFEGGPASVLHRAVPLARVASELGLERQEAAHAMERARGKLLAARERRPRPNRDDKILASWNGLLISALADAGRALGEPSWVVEAERAFAAIERILIHDGRVSRYFKDGAAPIATGGSGVAAGARPGFLDDQAYVGNAAIDLYEATGAPRYLELATRIADRMIARHEDAALGGFFFTPDDGDALLARTKDAFDQAIPSAPAMAALLCQRLAAAVDPRFAKPASRQLALFSGVAAKNAQGLGQVVLCLDRQVRGSVDVVLVGPRAAASTRALADVVFAAYLPTRTLVYVDPSDPATVAAAPLLAEGKPANEGASLAYVCRGRACSAPVSDPAELEALLRPGAEPAV
jgi:hypothetical protein